MFDRKMIRALALGAAAAVALGGAALAAAANVSGKWAGEVKLPTGQALPFKVTFEQNGAALGGKMDGINGAPDVTIEDGKMTADGFTYSGTRQINNMPAKFNYTGHVVADGIDIDIVRADGSQAPLKTHVARVAG